MFSKQMPSCGTWKSNLTRLTTIGLLLFSGVMDQTRAEISHYKMRVHKNFMKDVIDKNF